MQNIIENKNEIYSPLKPIPLSVNDRCIYLRYERAKSKLHKSDSLHEFKV